ncbi:MAG: DUF2786 domain-containing protein [Oscillibacter sp.]|nr:DUF2786 domain-containing protein [Oscillibacter sp.]
MENMQAKIRKLLALSQSSNEHEARQAPLRARELMAKHKLTERDCLDSGRQEVKYHLSDWTASARRYPWMVSLSNVIAEHYCCMAYRSRSYQKQTFRIGFVGFEDDTAVCAEVFAYAVRSILDRLNHMDDVFRFWHDAADKRRIRNSYGYGFVRGLEEAYELQTAQNQQWGLILSVPKEVEDAASSMKKKQFHAAAADQISESSYLEGVQDGRNFVPEKMLKESDCAKETATA